MMINLLSLLAFPTVKSHWCFDQLRVTIFPPKEFPLGFGSLELSLIPYSLFWPSSKKEGLTEDPGMILQPGEKDEVEF